MKNTYVKPMATLEEFIANEFVSVCYRWGVACSTNAANSKESSLRHPGIFYQHRGDQCGQFDHQAVYDRNGDGIPDEMIEEKTDQGKGDLPCTIYTDGTYSTVKAISSVNPGDYIYWRTTGKVFGSTITWSHQGTVQQVGNTTGHS